MKDGWRKICVSWCFSPLWLPWTSFSAPALAENQGDLDRCKFAGEFAKADESIAACDRVINDPKATAQDRSAALSSRCGWWWTKQDLDRALSDCNEAIRLYSGNPSAYLNRGNVYLSKSDSERALGDFNAAIRLDPEERVGLCRERRHLQDQG